MDGKRFDAFAVLFARTVSRRAGAKALAAGAAAALLSRPHGAAAAPCRTDRECGGGGKLCCSGRCVQTASDPSNCGRCNRICTEEEVCLNGDCVSNCPGRQVRCGRERECVDTRSDTSHCGRCGNDCDRRERHETCVRGTCTCEGERCAGGRCCPRGYACVEGGCCPVSAPQLCGNGRCCPDGATCCRDETCCPNGGTCCRGGGCCPAGQSCTLTGRCR